MSGFISKAIVVIPRKSIKPFTIIKRKQESDEAFVKRCGKYMRCQGQDGMLKKEVTKKGFKSNEIIYLSMAEVDVTSKARTLYVI
jgi:hypothetical protein